MRGEGWGGVSPDPGIFVAIERGEKSVRALECGAWGVGEEKREPGAAFGRHQILSTKSEIPILRICAATKGRRNKFKLPKPEFQNKRQHLFATMAKKKEYLTLIHTDRH